MCGSALVSMLSQVEAPSSIRTEIQPDAAGAKDKPELTENTLKQLIPVISSNLLDLSRFSLPHATDFCLFSFSAKYEGGFHPGLIHVLIVSLKIEEFSLFCHFKSSTFCHLTLKRACGGRAFYIDLKRSSGGKPARFRSFEAQRGAPWNGSGTWSRALAEASAQGYSSERLSSPPSAERRADGEFPGDDLGLQHLPWI